MHFENTTVSFVKKYETIIRLNVFDQTGTTHCDLKPAVATFIDSVRSNEAFVHRVWVVLY